MIYPERTIIFIVFFSGDAWIRVGIWLLIGVLVYIFYGRTRSSLVDVVYVPVAKTDLRRSSSGFMS
uniref:Cationic amino acid transporter C-terminal domain-containing protein n=1 Tax=Aegilops tauschii subsp. strangulata TaxID=200361 RepID=A0A453H0K8_AEGTS